MSPETLSETGSSASESSEAKSSPSICSGSEWIVDASGCNPDSLKNLELLQNLCEMVVSDLGLNVIGSPQWHRFPGPGGVTGLYLLSESHLACHTYPEFELLTLNLYCCRDRAEWPWVMELKQRFLAADVSVRRVNRGSRDAEGSA